MKPQIQIDHSKITILHTLERNREILKEMKANQVAPADFCRPISKVEHIITPTGYAKL